MIGSTSISKRGHGWFVQPSPGHGSLVGFEVVKAQNVSLNHSQVSFRGKIVIGGPRNADRTFFELFVQIVNFNSHGLRRQVEIKGICTVLVYRRSKESAIARKA